jgi:hypothetical protein
MNPYERELTPEDEEKIRRMMESNPVIDRLIAETICLMPEEDFNEIVKKHKKKELKEDPTIQKYTEFVLKTGKVLE